MNTKIKHIAMIFGCVAAMNIAVNSYAAGDLEWNTDRIGGDYKSFYLPVDNPLLCKEACAGEPKCKTATYAPSGVMGDEAYCWLKSSVPNPIVDNNRITWVKPN